MNPSIVKTTFISFPQLVQALNSNQFIRHEIRPELQSFARSGNIILTYYTANNQPYLVEVQYDPIKNEIKPPS